jgi:6-phosphofructokinase 1
MCVHAPSARAPCSTHYVYLPIPTVVQAARRVDPRGKQWNRLRASIGQPNFT